MTAGSAIVRGFLAGIDRRGCRIPTARRLLAGIICGLLAGAAAHANPTGPAVAHGTAQFANSDASTLGVTTSSNAIINWQGFSIGAGETTRFTQPSAASAVLNRVTGSDPSSILGRLLSNGRVFLVNPNGIVFGEDAVVDTAGLVASTLGISDANFLAGRYEFAAGPDAGDIANQGLIKTAADGVFLLAPSIENSGIIRTAGGDLVLAAGRTITLTSLDLDGVGVEVQAPEDEALNLGQLIAERGAAGVLAGSIRSSGTVEANAVTVDENGVIRLVARNDVTLEAGGTVAAQGPSGGEIHVESESGATWVSGEVSARASEGAGGTIRLLGNRVGLDGAAVDASGPTGGGEVLVGGDVSGEGEVPTADSTWVSADSTVSADALDDGDGGKVVVFAEGFANVQGKLSAQGGPNGGDGGFVETSGRESFVILQAPDTTAPNGDGGEWLIDPNDIEIVEGDANDAISGTNPFATTDVFAKLGIDLVIAALSGGQTVTVRTTESGRNYELGHITVNAALDVERTTGTNTLILDAHSGIRIFRPITDSAGGAVLNLVLDAGPADGVVGIRDDVTLRGGSLRTEGRNRVDLSHEATVTLDGATWTMNNNFLLIGGDEFARGPGRVFLQNGAALEGRGTESDAFIVVGKSEGHGILTVSGGSVVGGFGWIGVGDGAGGTGALNVENGGSVMAKWIDIGNEGGSGTAIVTGPGSTLRAVGEENAIVVGEKGGTGTLHVRNGGNVTARWINIGDDPGSGTVTGTGTVTVMGPGSSITTVGEDHSINVGDEGAGELTIENGGEVRTNRFTVADDGGSNGTVTVSGSGSSLTTVGTDNEVFVGNHGTGTIRVLDGGLVDTRKFHLAWWGAGRAVIRGVAEDGTRSRVIVWPANGRASESPSEAGFARVARNAGSNGHLEIREGGLLRVLDGDDTFGPGFHLARNKGSTGTLLIDGEGSSLEVIQNGPAGDYGPSVTLGRRGGGVTTIRNGGRLLLRGERASFEVSRDSVSAAYPDSDTGPIDQRSEVDILSGGVIEVDGERASVVIGNGGPAADGVVTVSGPGSTLVTRGLQNSVVVGDEGTGTLNVLDGGLVDTLLLDVGRSAVGRLVISGVAADGTRSRVIVSPANGKFSGVFADTAGVARAGRNAGSHGFVEILDGGLLRILDGDGTHGPGFSLARNKGSEGTLLIDGDGSSLEVIQTAPAVDGNPDVSPGPYVTLARRGGGTTTIRNGARLLVRGESAFAQVSRDSLYDRFPDSDAGTIDQPSVVRIESGGRVEVEGEGAGLVIGDSGPGADGTVTVIGAGAVLDVSGTGNRIVVGDDGGTGVLEAHDGGAVGYAELVVGENGTTNVTAPDEVQEPVDEVREQVDEVTDEVLHAQDLTTQEVAGDDEEPEEEEDDDTEEAAAVDETGETEEEELQPCPM